MPIANQRFTFMRTLFASAQLISATTTRLRALALVTVTVLAATACSSGDSMQDHIAKARQYIAEEKYRAAVIELKNALRIDRDSAEAGWLLGSAYLSTGDPASAEKELLRAQQLGWTNNSVLPALAEALYLQGKNEAVSELPHEDLTPEASAQLLSIKALAQLAQGESAKASVLIALALEFQPDSIDAKIAEARLLAAQGDLIGALIVLEEVLDQDPDRGDAWSLKGDILLSKRNLAEALSAYDESISLQKPGYVDRWKRALINMQNQDYAAVQADADAVLRARPNHPFGNYLMGLVNFHKPDYSAAITLLTKAEPAWQQIPLVLYFLGSAHLLNGSPEQAEVFANRFFAAAPDSVDGRKLLAVIHLQQGEFGDAYEVIEPALAAAPDDIVALNLAANALMGDGKTDLGLDYLERIAELQPDSAVAQVRLGAGLFTVGQAVEGAQHIEIALDLNPEMQQAQVLAIFGHVQANEFDEAIEAAKLFREQHPGEASTSTLLGRVYLAAGQEQLAMSAFTEALEVDPGDLGANRYLVELALASDDFELARQRYNAVLEYHPDHLPTLLGLARLDGREQDEESMVKRLQQAHTAHPTSPEPVFLLGSYYFAAGYPERVESLIQPLGSLQKKSPQIQLLLAMAYLSRQETAEKAQYTLEQLIDLSPDKSAYHHLLAMAAASVGDKTEMKAGLIKAVELNPESLPSLIALAKLARIEGESEEFQQYLERLTLLAPDNLDVMRLRAMAAQDRGEFSTAVELGASVYTARPSTRSMKELAGYYYSAGDSAKAFSLQEDWIDNHPDDISARLKLADYLRLENRSDEAIAQNRKIVELDPDNLVALNNLAWDLRLIDPKAALGYILRAEKVAPESAAVLDTLAVIEHLNGQYEQASLSIQRALVNSPGDPTLLYHQAMIKAALGDKKAASSLLDKLLGQAADFPEREDAEALQASLQG